MFSIIRCMFTLVVVYIIQNFKIVDGNNVTDWVQNRAVIVFKAKDRVMHSIFYVRNASLHNPNVTHGKSAWKEDFIGLDESCSFTLTPGNWRDLISKLKSSQYDIYNITVNGKVVSKSYAIMNFADYRTETDHIFLPFPVNYITDIMQFSPDYVTSIDKKASVNTTKIDIPVFQNCISSDDATDRDEERQQMSNVLYNLLFLLQLSGDQQLCSVETWRKVGVDVKAHRPWLGTCCGASLHDIRGNKDYATRRKNINEKLQVNFECHEPDILRENVIIIAKLLSVILTLLSPLFVRLIPSQPWRHRHIIPLRSISCDEGVAQNPTQVALEMNHNVECTNHEVCDGEEIVENSEFDDTRIQVEKKNVKSKFRSISFNLRKRKKCRDMEWISLDCSSVYRFGFSMLIYYFGLFHVRMRTLVILRRIVFIFGCLVFTSYLYEVFRIYYFYLLKLEFVTHHAQLVLFIKKVSNLENITEQMESYLYIFILPSIYTIIIFITIAHSLLYSHNICKSLHWIDNGLFFGRRYKIIDEVDNAENNRREPIRTAITYNGSWEHSLYANMKRRLMHLLSAKFWKFWWQECVCGSNPFERLGKSCCAHVLFAIWALVRSIVFLILFVIYATPAVGVFTGIARRTFERTRMTCRRRFLLVMRFISTVGGFCVIYLELMTLTYLVIQLVTFICIDILRNVDDSLPYLILIASVVLYVEGSLTSLEDEYRQIKGIIFDVAESLVPDDDDEKIVCSFRPFPPLLKFTNNKERKHLPKPIFDTICYHCLPLKKSVMKRMVSLIMSILIIGLIFSIVIKFRILGDFSKESETVITLLTVSIPRLLGFMKSEKAEELRTMRLRTKIESTLSRLTIKLSQDDSVI